MEWEVRVGGVRLWRLRCCGWERRVAWRGSVEGVPGQGEGRPDRQMLFSGWMHLVRLCTELALTPCWLRAGSAAHSGQRR